ncbi:hypothetical protein WMY93_000010 [Mugilogobius chulae]|uniref:Uncharacterized protein n=1 Tax=Mugilogobius chulae TaxID=88201 RepID=A0AAW0Q110_9GOBI
MSAGGNLQTRPGITTSQTHLHWNHTQTWNHHFKPGITTSDLEFTTSDAGITTSDLEYDLQTWNHHSPGITTLDLNHHFRLESPLSDLEHHFTTGTSDRITTSVWNHPTIYLESPLQLWNTTSVGPGITTSVWIPV